MISSEISSEIRHREDAGWAARVLSGSCPWEPWREESTMGNMAVLSLEVAVRPCLFDPVPFFIILHHSVSSLFVSGRLSGRARSVGLRVDGLHLRATGMRSCLLAPNTSLRRWENGGRRTEARTGGRRGGGALLHGRVLGADRGNHQRGCEIYLQRGPA